jgi:hypothetical protein
MLLNEEPIVGGQILQEPWPHQIIEQTIDQKSFEVLKTIPRFLLTKENIQKNSFLKEKIFFDARTSPGGAVLDILDLIKCGVSEDVVEVLFDVAQDFLKLSKSILDRYPNSRKPSPEQEVFVQANINLDFPYNWFPPHDDVSRKIITFIVYLSPENNIGTILHSIESEDDVQKIVEWKPNSSILFCPEKDVTWHSFKASDKLRVVCAFFIEVNVESRPIFEYNFSSGKKARWIGKPKVN